jgi:hypothetical protein
VTIFTVCANVQHVFTVLTRLSIVASRSCWKDLKHPVEKGHVLQRQAPRSRYMEDTERRGVGGRATLNGCAATVDSEVAGDGWQAGWAVGIHIERIRFRQRIDTAGRQVERIRPAVVVRVLNGPDQRTDTARDVALADRGLRR